MGLDLRAAAAALVAEDLDRGLDREWDRDSVAGFFLVRLVSLA